MHRRNLLQAAWSGAALAALPAGARAAPVDEALFTLARQEGKVVWYTSLIANVGARPLAAAFEAAYPGIKVDLVAGTNDDLVVKLLAEGRAGRMNADVSHGGSAVIPARKAGLVASYAPPAAASYPAEYRAADGSWVAEDVLFLGASANTDLVADADLPRSATDLLATRWRGRIAWCSQLTQGGPPGYVGAVLTSMGATDGMMFLRALAKQQVVNVVGNQRVVLDQVIAGEYPLALMTFNHHAAISRAAGAPVRWLGLTPVVTNLDALFLLQGAPHPNAGKLFIDFLLSDAGQSIFRDAGYIPAAPDVEAKLPGLTPQAGHFSPVVITPEMVDRNMADWLKIYRDIFG